MICLSRQVLFLDRGHLGAPTPGPCSTYTKALRNANRNSPGASPGSPGFPLVLFIASASRSGSTLLDLMLGSHPLGVSTGEVRRLQGFVSRDRQLLSLEEDYPLTCSCGKPVGECDFWKEVERRFGTSFGNTVFKTRQKRIWRSVLMAFYLSGGVAGMRVLAQAWPPLRQEVGIGLNCFRLHQAISSASGASFVVDSSKSIYHYMLLHLAAPEMMRLVVLVRDGRAVAHSMTRGPRARQWEKSSLHPFLQASRQWALTTRSILVLSRRTRPSQRIFLRYEDFCQDHMQVLRQVAERWGLSPWEDPIQVESRERHIVGGSPSVRFEKSPGTIKVDNSWRDSLEPELLEGFERIAGKLNRKLGYF